eukprot:3934792-Rhodomonas_salina.4
MLKSSSLRWMCRSVCPLPPCVKTRLTPPLRARPRISSDPQASFSRTRTHLELAEPILEVAEAELPVVIDVQRLLPDPISL